MTELELYQNAVIEAIEQKIDAETTLNDYLKRLAETKADRLWDNNAGNAFKLRMLKDQEAELVAIDYKVETGVECGNPRTIFDRAIEFQFAFAINPLGCTKEATAKERKLLDELQGIIKKAHENAYVSIFQSSSYDRLSNIDYELAISKHHYELISFDRWRFNLDDITSEDFLEKSVMIEGQELLSY